MPIGGSPSHQLARPFKVGDVVQLVDEFYYEHNVRLLCSASTLKLRHPAIIKRITHLHSDVTMLHFKETVGYRWHADKFEYVHSPVDFELYKHLMEG